MVVMQRMLTDGKTSVYEAQWRPDGKKIGYLSSESGSHAALGNESRWIWRQANV